MANFLNSFLFLLSFFGASMSTWGGVHSLGLVTVLLASPNMYGELGERRGFKPDGARETFVLLRVIVLQVDWRHHHLQNLPVHAVVSVQDFPLHPLDHVLCPRRLCSSCCLMLQKPGQSTNFLHLAETTTKDNIKCKTFSRDTNINSKSYIT